MRLEGQKKLGFYPTPWEIFTYIRKMFRPANKVTFLDPCCGDGRALYAFLKTNLAQYAYGIELDIERGNKSIEILQKYFPTNRFRVLIGDIFDTVIRPVECFSLLFLNPPYDYDKENKRAEITFLKHAYRWLKPEGLLIYIIPEPILFRKDLKTWLSLKFKNISVFRFPEREYQRFKQIILLATKKSEKDLKSSEIPTELEYIDRVTEFPQYELTPGELPKVFESYQLAPEDILNRFNDSVKEVKRATNLEIPDIQKHLSPLFPLRKGHLLAYISTGALNHVPINDKVIKSFSTREQLEIETETEKIVKDVYKTCLRVIDLTKKEWYDVK